MRVLALAAMLASACGDNAYTLGEPIGHADTVFFAAHTDDDMIFMQPEVVDAARSGSIATVYFTVGDAVKGYGLARGLLRASKTAYAGIAGGAAWDCGYVDLAVPVQHCKLVGHEVSLIAVDLPDGGIPGDRTESLLHLVDGSVPSVDLVSPAGGTATRETTAQLAVDLLAALAPDEIHALELAGTHGRDHSSHMFSSAFLFWAAARSGYAGPLTWHRGYNVASEPVTLDGPDYDDAVRMLGFYEACASDCAACGVPCQPDAVSPAHVTWLERQHAVARVRSAGGKLAFGDQCLQVTAALGDCASAPVFALASDGRLQLGDACLTARDDGALSTAVCDGSAAQYWVLDGEGSLWNGLPPLAAGDMSYDHVRCLAVTDAVVSAATCGATNAFAWQFRD